jgi:hypothetical protein
MHAQLIEHGYMNWAVCEGWLLYCCYGMFEWAEDLCSIINVTVPKEFWFSCLSTFPSTQNSTSNISNWDILKLNSGTAWSVATQLTRVTQFTNYNFSQHNILFFFRVTLYYMFRPCMCLFVQLPWLWNLCSLHWPVFTYREDVNAYVCPYSLVSTYIE